MTMQYDVKSGHLNQSGFVTQGRVRLKQLTYAGNGGQAGYMIVFDTAIAPTAATYSRSGTTVTIASTAHGLATGQTIGIGFGAASGASATDGNYTVTVVNANSFTITDPNSGTVAGGTSCTYVVGPNSWVTAFDTLTGATGGQQVSIPGEGLLVLNGLYVFMSNVTFVTAFYG